MPSRRALFSLEVGQTFDVSVVACCQFQVHVHLLSKGAEMSGNGLAVHQSISRCIAVFYWAVHPCCGEVFQKLQTC